MLGAAHLRAKAAEYRAAAKTASDAKTRDLYLSVAKYLADWAAQAEQRMPRPRQRLPTVARCKRLRSTATGGRTALARLGTILG